MSQSPSRFDVSSVNGVQQCDCWRHHFSSLCSVSRVLRFLPVSPMSVAWQSHYLIFCTSPCPSSGLFLSLTSVSSRHNSPWVRKRNLPPPPLGDFCRHVSFQSFTQGYLKMHVCTWLVGGCGCAATFFSSAKSHRLPTPRGELTSSKTPLPTKITLKVI